MQILIESYEINRKIESIKTVKKDLSDEMIQIEQLINSMGMDWQGESERAFVSKLTFIRKEYDKLIGFYDDFIELLRDISDKDDKLERSIITAINQI